MKQARFTRDRVSALSKPDLIDLVMKLAARNALLQTRFDELEKQNRQLQEQNASLVQRVSDLERRLGLNSSNSSNRRPVTGWRSQRPEKDAPGACAANQAASLVANMAIRAQR